MEGEEERQEEGKGARSGRSKRYIASVFEKGGGKMMSGRLHSLVQ